MVIIGLAIAFALTGCSSPSTAAVESTPAPTVTVTVAPSPAEGQQVGDDFTPLEAWDICVARTQQETQSDWTEWAHYSPDAVKKPGQGEATVTITNVRSNTDDNSKTVTCSVSGRVGAIAVDSWVRK